MRGEHASRYTAGMSTFALILFAILLSCGWGLLGAVIGSLFSLSLSDALVSGLTAIGIVVIMLALFVGRKLSRHQRSLPSPAGRSGRRSRRVRAKSAPPSPPNSRAAHGDESDR